jgi:uncharacterized repeat protein (TIGR01451 family)
MKRVVLSKFIFKINLLIFICLCCFSSYSQVSFSINANNPNFPFPQFTNYSGSVNTLANNNPQGVPHAEMEQRIRDAYQILTNNMTYNVNNNGTYGPVTVAGVKYIMPHDVASGADISHCTCVEGDGYYLLAAAYMADKATFDGYYMWMHDRQFQKTQRFIDCVVNSPTYAYSPGISGAGSSGAPTNVKGGGLTGNSAMDGDVDVALALLMAWKQWGDVATICTNPCTGAPVYYKTEAINYIKTLVDTLKYTPSLPIKKYLSGDIGLDGYHKGGDSWQETTNWATGGTYLGLDPEQAGSQMNYVDYAAPGYFRSFSDMLTAEGQSPWCIKQYQRAEASDDWLIGQTYAQGLLPYAGQYTVAGTTPTFSSFGAAEDFRFAWRTTLNYLWNGAPSRSWNPTTHQDVAGSNTYELDAAKRFATFMKSAESAPYNNTCQTANTLTYGGPPNLKWSYNTNGTGGGSFPLNWIHGAGAPSAVISGDADLMAQMFRHCVIEWDQYNDNTQKYLTSKPRYFHEWFRLLGMLVLTGNYHNPMDIPKANMKVYKSVDKTYAFPGDTLTYTLSYRNYGKPLAFGVTLTDNLPAGLSFISATGGGVAAGSSVSWNIGLVPGFVTGGLAATMGSVTLKVKVTAAATGRLCNVANIICSNGTGWTSNEYPNNITDVMERNCVDILVDNPLTIKKTASRSLVSAGDTVSYTIVVKNKSVAFLNGGRPGVLLAGAHSGLNASASSVTLKYRVYHGAHEAYINYQNYRVSYFMNKPGPPTWITNVTVNEGSATAPTPGQQSLVPGATWNHRFMLTFPSQIATITQFLYFYSGQGRFIHEGALMPQRLVFDVHDAANSSYNWTNDWSSEPTVNAADGDPYWPIANDWTDPLVPNKAVTKYHPNNCSNNVTKTITKQLVEEWDGYTWRRTQGDAPVSGRDLYNIVVKDTLPPDVTFGGFFSGFPTGSVAGNVITWPTISTLKINDSIVYKFYVTLKSPAYFSCPSPGPTPSSFTNRASAKADKEALALASAVVNVSCTAVPPPPTSVAKTADKASYNVGDPITYTINYTNKDGATYNKPAAMAAADWTNRKSTTTVNASNITTIANNQSVLTNNYAHGVNGTVSFTVQPTQYATFGIALRNSGGATFAGSLYITVKVQNSTIDLSLWNGTTQVGATSSLGGYFTPPLAAGATFDMKIDLSGTNAKVYITNMVTPALTFSGLPITTAGWAGIINGTPGGADAYATHIITNWNSHFDSAFNLQVTDPKPSPITYVSATNATYNAVNYSGSNVAGTVTWATIPGPILANDVVSFVWKGTVASCPGTSTITNIAYAKLYGISPDPSGQVDVGCSTVAAPVSWLYFNAVNTSSGNVLTWSTAAETNNKQFIIERSEDGIHFNKISSIAGAGNSNVVKEYLYTDNSYTSALTYYRIVQMDYDGKASASNVVAVSAGNTFALQYYPNPFTSSTTLIVKSNTPTARLTVSSVLGVELEVQSIETNKEISIGENLASGTYIIYVESEAGRDRIRLVKNE